jgi:ADP-heptose:LPS heptosyltransferase
VFEPSAVKRILVLVYGGLGNVVLFLPALAALRRRFPQAEIVAAVGAGRGNRGVLGNGVVDRFIELPASQSFFSRARAIRALRDEEFDLVISKFLCSFPWQARAIAFSGIPWRCGHVSSPGWQGSYDYLYNIPVVMERDQHEVDRYLELVYALGVERGTVDRHPRLSFDEATEQAGAALLSRRGVAPTSAYVVVHAGTSAGLWWKQWGVDRYEEVVLRLAAADPALRFVLVGSNDERAAQEEMIDTLSTLLPNRFADIVGATDVPTLIAVIARARLFIGNDSGPMQIAVALDIPVVVPWGPSDYPRNAPRDPMHTVLFKGLECSPCYRMPGDSKVHLCNDHQCLDQIAIEEVVAAAASKLAQPTRVG